MTGGTSAGSLLYARLVSPAWRMRLTGVLAVAACAVLMLFAFSPNLASALTILGVSGLFACPLAARISAA